MNIGQQNCITQRSKAKVIKKVKDTHREKAPSRKRAALKRGRRLFQGSKSCLYKTSERYTAKNTVISPISWCRNFTERHSCHTRNSGEIMVFFAVLTLSLSKNNK